MSLYATCPCGVPEGQEGPHRTDCPLYGVLSVNDIVATSDRLARRMGGRFVVNDPVVDPRLWCLHHIGPDDVHPAPDFATAQKWADWANRRFAEHSDLSRFVVAIWPWSAERHADGLAKSVEEWTLPTVGFDKEWCVNMAKKEAGYAIGAGELAIDPFTPSALSGDAGERE